MGSNISDKDVKNAWYARRKNGSLFRYSWVTNNKDSLAALMAHEIAHAVARHGS